MSAPWPAGSADILAGVDAGGSHIRVLLTDLELQPVGRTVQATVTGQPERAADQIVATVQAAIQAAGLTIDRLAAVGVGVPGQIDRDDGTVDIAVNLGWRRVALREGVEDRLRVPCVVENDVRAAARGLRARRVLGEIEDLVYISVGTGIAAGIVLGGELHPGSHSLSGEIGHIVVDPEGPACACGLSGCLEAVAAGPAIAARAEVVLATGRGSSLAGRQRISSKDVYEAAAAGDPVALDITQSAGRHLAHVIHHLAVTLDVDAVCLGGGVSGAGPAFLDPIERELDRLRGASELAAKVLPRDLVHLLPAGSDAGGWGAVLLAREGRTSRSVRDPSEKEVGARSLPSPLTS